MFTHESDDDDNEKDSAKNLEICDLVTFAEYLPYDEAIREMV